MRGSAIRGTDKDTYGWRAVEVHSVDETISSFNLAELPNLNLPQTLTSKASKAAAMLTNSAAAVEGLRAVAQTFRGRVWPHTKAQVKAAIAALHLEQPAWLLHWSRQTSQLVNCTSEKQVKNIAKIFKGQWQQLGVLTGSKNSYKWNQPKIAALLDAHISPRQTAVSAPLGPAPVTESAPSSFHLSSGEEVELVQTVERLKQLLASDAALNGDAESVVAVDCEGVPEALHLIQLATSERVLVIDGVELGQAELCEVLTPLFTSERTIKLLHDLHKDAAAIATIGSVTLVNCLDSQLAMELLSGSLHMGFNDMLKELGREQHPSKLAMKRRMASDDSGGVFARRPLPRDVIEYAAMDVTLLLGAHTSLVEMLGADQLNEVVLASGIRAEHAATSGGRRRVCVDVSSEHALASRELIEVCRPAAMLATAPLVVSNEVGPLLALLPADITASLDGLDRELSDIVLDKGRRPQAWIAGKRVFLGASERTVLADDLESIVSNLGGFGSDNRAGLEAQLHRVSAIRNRADAVIGLTMRIGRHVGGNAGMIADLLFHEDGSLLFLGEPGSGKTTIVREATRLLAEMSNVLIVDTSNEIAGDGDVPHPCVGLARRLQVRALDEQGSVMIEGVQNHTPEVMVIDEIGRPTEVEAARTCKTRGVRMIASAHGDLRKLVKNKQLRGLVGGVEAVTLGDATAKEQAKRRGAPGGAIDKVMAQRAGPPIFDIIIELRRGEPHEWRIVKNSGKAVDEILQGSHYLSQRRTRDPATGEFFIELEKA